VGHVPDDGRVLQARQRRRLARHAPDIDLGVAGEHLQGHGARGGAIDGAIHGAHAAAGGELDDLEPFADHAARGDLQQLRRHAAPIRLTRAASPPACVVTSRRAAR
jgi:hypothetical protein